MLTHVRPCLLLSVGLLGAPTALVDGNVTVILDEHGSVQVIGDELSNNIIICPTGCAFAPFFPEAPEGAILVWSQDETLKPDTTINGLPGWPGTWIAGGSRVSVSLNGGDDHVRLASTYSTWALPVDLFGGHGDDVLNLTGAQMLGDVSVDAGPGNDRISAEEGFSVGGTFLIMAGPGDDGFFSSVATIGADGRTTKIDMGPGEDRFWCRDSVDFRGLVMLDLGPGADSLLLRQRIRFFAPALLSAGSGMDSIRLSGVVARSFVGLDAGPDYDFLSLDFNVFEQDVRLDGGAGLDVLQRRGPNSFRTSSKVLSFEFKLGLPQSP